MVKTPLSNQSMITFEALMAAQANSIRVLNESKMPHEMQSETIKVLSSLMALTLNMSKDAFGLTDDEVMSLLTLSIVKVLELTDE